MKAWLSGPASTRAMRVQIPPRELSFLAALAGGMVVAAGMLDPGTWGELLAIASAAAVLFAVMRWSFFPVELGALVLVVLVGRGVQGGHVELALFLVPLLVLYAAWYQPSLMRSAVVMAIGVVAPGVIVLSAANDPEIAWAPWATASVLTWIIGRTLYVQQQLIAQLHAARELVAQQAVAQERRRIAQELHDVAGHTLAAMILHVSGARHVVRRDLEEAERALDQAEVIGRESMDQIRCAVAVLRTTDEGTEPALAESGDVGDVIAEYRRAGLQITAEIDPRLRQVHGPWGLAVHRICREALSNIARHAPTNKVHVNVCVNDDPRSEVHMVISDEGKPAKHQSYGAHFGLVGMRERAQALGGHVHAGPHDRGWRVAASIPLPDEVGKVNDE